jgi:hypothetical protein
MVTPPDLNQNINTTLGADPQMKYIIRTFVIVLALTGAAASIHINSTSAMPGVVAAKVSAIPTPWCPPDDPDACGIGQ